MKSSQNSAGAEIHETYSFFVKMNPEHKRRLLSKEEEFSLSREIKKTRAKLWYELFGYAPMTEGMAEYVQESLDIDFSNLISASRAHRDSCKKKDKTNWDVARFDAAIQLEEADKDTDLAFEILSKIENGEKFGASIPASSRPFEEYKKNCRMMAMRHQSHRHEFQKANVFLALTIARKMDRKLVPFADLVQQAMMGLMKAVNRFDASKGFRFSTYCVYWIRHYITRYVSNHARQIRLPSHVIDMVGKIKKAKKNILLEGEETSIENIAKFSGLSKEEVSKYIEFDIYVESLDELVDPKEDRSYDGNNFSGRSLDFFTDPEELPSEVLEEKETNAQLAKALEKLPERLRYILENRYGLNGNEPLKLKDLGLKMGLSRERVRQLQVLAEDELKKVIEI